MCRSQVEVFDKVQCDIVQFPLTHDEKHFWYAYNVNIHDESSNDFKKTGIKDMIRVARNEKDRGGDTTWEATAKA